MGELTTRFPWEKPAVQPVEETVELLKRDFAYAVQFTAVLVHSKHPALQMLVNTRRGQIVPRGECRLSDGTTFEMQDVGMPQPNSPTMTVQELIVRVADVVRELGLEIAP